MRSSVQAPMPTTAGLASDRACFYSSSSDSSASCNHCKSTTTIHQLLVTRFNSLDPQTNVPSRTARPIS